jgi:DNA-binding CsgD family transcriptional regulator
MTKLKIPPAPPGSGLIPPPPDAPQLMASNDDESFWDSMLGPAPQEQSKPLIASSDSGGGNDKFWDSILNEPSKPAAKPAAAAPKKAAINAAIAKLATPPQKPAAKPVKQAQAQAPAAQPQSPMDQVGAHIGQQLGNLGQTISNLPLVGDAVKGAGQLWSEVSHNPAEAAATAVANIPAGIASVPQDIGNLAQYVGNATKSIAPQTAVLGALPIPGNPAAALAMAQNWAQSMGYANRLLGRRPEQPIAVAEALNRAIQGPQQPLNNANPASAGLGQMAGSMMLPTVAGKLAGEAGPMVQQILGPAFSGKIPGVANKYVAGALQGAATGAAYGGAGDLAQQAAKQETQGKINPANLNPGQTLQAAAKGILPGAGLGAIGAMFHNPAAAKETAEAKPPEKPAETESKPAEKPEEKPAEPIDQVKASTAPEYVNPFDGTKKGNLKQFESTLNSEFDSTSMNDADQLKNDALGWIKKNVNATDMRKQYQQKVESAHEQFVIKQAHEALANEAIAQEAAPSKPDLKIIEAPPEKPELKIVEGPPEPTEEPKQEPKIVAAPKEVDELIEDIPNVPDNQLTAHFKAINKGLKDLPAGQFKTDLQERMDSLYNQRKQVPQNSQAQTLPAPANSEAPGSLPAEPQITSKPASEAEVQNAPPVVPENETQSKGTPEITETKMEPAPAVDFGAMGHQELQKWGEDNHQLLVDHPNLLKQWQSEYLSKAEQANPEPAEEPAAEPTKLPDYLQEAIDRNYANAQQLGIVENIKQLAAQGKTAKEIANALGTDTETVRSVRSKERIPATDEPEFAEWAKAQQPKKKSVFDLRKTKTGHEIFDTESGEVVRKGNYSKEKMQQIVDDLNTNGLPDKRQGKRTDIDRANERSAELEAYQNQIIDNGKNFDEIKDKLSPDDQNRLKNLAQVKYELEQARAWRRNVLRGVAKRLGTSLETKTERSREYSPEFESLVKKAAMEDGRPDTDFSIEVNSNHNPPLKPEDYSAMTPEQAIEQAHAADKLADEADKTYRKLREKHVSKIVPTLRRAGEPSVNIEHEGSITNVRLSPKAELAKEAAPLVKTAERQVTNYTADGVTKKARMRVRGGRSQRGAAMLPIAKPKNVMKTTKAPAEPKAAPTEPTGTVEDKIADSVAEGAQKKIPVAMEALKRGAEVLRPLIDTRRSFDLIHDFDNGLHNRLWWNIAKEAHFGEGVSFKPDDAQDVNETLKMSPEDILAGQGAAANFDDRQRFFLAQRKELRKQSAKLIQTAIDGLKEAHGTREEMPQNARDTYDSLKSVHDGLTGQSSRADSTLSDLTNNFMGAMYDYVFKWNPSYHALNLTDPLIMGSPRAGISNILQAKMMLNPITGDPAIRKYIANVADRMEGPISTMRKEARLEGRASGGFLGKLRSLPDLPSVEWNNRDMFLAAVLKHAKDTGRDPVQYAKDMADGKLSDQDKIATYVEALKINQDVNGSGTFGLDKDLLQKSPLAKSVVQFTSQSYRVSRMLKQWTQRAATGDKDAIRSILTFAAIQASLGGHSVVPKEAWLALKASSPQNEDLANKWEDSLDKLSLPRMFGRDLSDKLTLSTVPVFSGTARNFAFDDLVKRIDNAKQGMDKGDYKKLVRAVLPIALSSIIGGGGNLVQRSFPVQENLPTGKRKYSIYPQQSASLIPGLSDRPEGSITLPYGAKEAAADFLLPGERKEVSEKRKELRNQKTKKRNLMNLRKEKP